MAEQTAQIFRMSKQIRYYTDSLKSFGLKNADFTYYPAVDSIKDLTKDNQPIVLKKISIEIGKGEYVAFTGHSGCGKSTVQKLLMSIYQLDGGIDTLLGERGTGLSEGQMQRIAIARAIFSERRYCSLMKRPLLSMQIRKNCCSKISGV